MAVWKTKCFDFWDNYLLYSKWWCAALKKGVPPIYRKSANYLAHLEPQVVGKRYVFVTFPLSLLAQDPALHKVKILQKDLLV